LGLNFSDQPAKDALFLKLHSFFDLMAISVSTNFVTKLASIALGLCLVGIVAFWASKLLAPRVAVAPVVVSAPPSDNQESVFTKQLFGNAPVAAAANTTPADSRLQVQGVIASASGVAVLSVDGAAAKPFTVGQTVTQGVVLTQVKVDKVVVRRDGVEQTLPTPVPPNKSILTAGKSAVGAPPTSPYPPFTGTSNANQAVPGSGGLPPQLPPNQSQNLSLPNAQVQQVPSNSDPGAQNSPLNNNTPQSNPVGSSMRSGGPQ
jgi:Type II secretion system protein C